MCGRYLLTATPEELQALFGHLDGEDFPPRYNIAPTQPIAVVRMLHGDRRFALVRWGFVPAFIKDPKAFGLMINARSESAARNSAFKGAMKYRRSLVPASGFYEWQKTNTRRKQPYYVRPRDRGVVAFGGLWETWSGADGSEIDTGLILTTAANDTVAPIHDRMPLVVAPQDFDRWLDPGEAVDDLLHPAPDDLMETVRIGDQVNAYANDNPGLIEPSEATGTDTGLPLFDR